MRKKPQPGHEPTVHIVDDDPGVRKALALLMRSAGLQAQPYESAQDFLDRYEPGQPGCMILDIRMPGMNGLELQQELVARHEPMPIIILTGHGDIPMAVRAIKAGALDFIEKPFQNGTLLSLVETGLKQDRTARAEYARLRDIDRRLARLTPREREVMEHLIHGELSKVAAAELGISPRTVEIHRARILKKLGVRSISEVVHMTLQVQDQTNG
jgi:FixJ family two-component response regulator